MATIRGASMRPGPTAGAAHRKALQTAGKSDLNRDRKRNLQSDLSGLSGLSNLSGLSAMKSGLKKDLKTDLKRDSKENPERNLLSDGDYPQQQESGQRAMGSAAHIEQLLHRNPKLWRGCDMAGRGSHGLSTGYPELDEILPGRGWPHNGLVEVISKQWGMGELQLLLPLMRSVIAQGKWVLWISPPHQLYAPALVQAGVDIEQVLVVKADTSCRDALWSMEKALQSGSCGLVLAWQDWLPGRVLRRLQLAGETGDTLGVLFKHNVSKHSPSPLRMEIKSFHHDSSDFTEAEVSVLKARGNFRPLSTRLTLYPHFEPGFRPGFQPNPEPRPAVYAHI